MAYQLFHFRGSDKILEFKFMGSDLAMTTEFIFNSLKNGQPQNAALRAALDKMGWHLGETWNIIGGHQYRHIGYKRGVGIEACMNGYGYFLEGLCRLQLGFDKGKIDAGIMLLTLNGIVKDKSRDLKTLITKDMDALAPTISLPVCVCLYDFSEHSDQNGL